MPKFDKKFKGELRYFLLLNLIQFGIELDRSSKISTLITVLLKSHLPEDSNEINVDNHLFYLIIDVITRRLLSSLVGLIVGSISDHWTSRYGRRNFFMLIALIPFILGTIFLALSGIYPLQILESDGNETITTGPTWITLILYCIGFLLWTIGFTTISVMYRSFLLDQFDTSQQNRLNLIKTFYTGLAWILNYGILMIFTLSTFHYNHQSSESLEDITRMRQIGCALEYSLCLFSAISLVIGVLLFTYVAQEPQYIPSAINNGDTPQTKKEAIKYCFTNIINGFKSMDASVFSILVVVFFGWFNYRSYSERMEETYSDKLFPGINHVDTRYLMLMVNSTIQGIILVILSSILYIWDNFMDKFTIISFFINGLVAIMYYFVESMEENGNDKQLMIKNYFLTAIPTFFSTMIYCGMKTFPYSLLREFGERERYGVLMGIKNLFVNLSYISAYILFVIDELGNENYQANYMKYICPICFMTWFVSFLLFYIHDPSNKNRTNDYIDEGEYMIMESQNNY